MSGRKRTGQVRIRLSRDTNDLLRSAAAVEGQSLSEFIVGCSTERARELLEQHRVITMSQAAFDAFVAALDEPEVRPATPLAAQAIKDYAAEIK